MKNIIKSKNVFFILIFLVCFGQHSLAEIDQEILKYRPSYRKIFEPCHQNQEQFTQEFFGQIYHSSLMETLSSFSPEQIETWILDRGISSQLAALLDNDTTSPALKNCFGSLQLEQQFIKNLFIADSMGKLVGVCIQVAGLRYLPSLIKSILTPAMRHISLPMKLSKTLTKTLIGALWAAPLTRYYYERLHPQPEESPEKNSLSEIIDQSSTRLANKASQAIYEINETLKNQKLSDIERTSYQESLRQWQIVFKMTSTRINEVPNQ